MRLVVNSAERLVALKVELLVGLLVLIQAASSAVSLAENSVVRLAALLAAEMVVWSVWMWVGVLADLMAEMLVDEKGAYLVAEKVVR